MASSTRYYLLILFISFLSLSTQVFSSSDNNPITSSNLPNTLFQKGYLSMSIILESTLNRLISSAPNNNTTFTIFCPTEKGLLKLVSKYPDPPYRLIQYQVVPLKINKEILETSIPNYSKLETLLPGHSIVITTLPQHEQVSINNVNVIEWNVYNSGRVIVHGVDEFFDPALEILVYPNNDKYVEKTEKKRSFEGVIGYWLNHPQLSQLILLVMIVAFVIVSSCYLVHYKSEDEEYRMVDEHIPNDKYVLIEEDADVKDVQSYENIP